MRTIVSCEQPVFDLGKQSLWNHIQIRKEEISALQIQYMPWTVEHGHHIRIRKEEEISVLLLISPGGQEPTVIFAPWEPDNRYLLCILSITSLWPCCLENLSCLLADWKALGARSRNPIFPSACRTWCMLLRCWVYNWGTAVAVVQNLYFCCNKAFFYMLLRVRCCPWIPMFPENKEDASVHACFELQIKVCA